MIVEDQSGVIAFLRSLSSKAAGGQGSEEIETHISHVFLAGDRAFKLKRAVRLPYVDFSTAAKRFAACEKEVALNSLTAPSLYLGVRRICCRSDGGFQFSDEGELVDAVVEMHRFDQGALLDSMAMKGELTADHAEQIASMVARFHKAAAIVPGNGGAANIAAVLDINERGFATSTVFENGAVGELNARFREQLMRHADTLDRRANAGKIRRCHGDLHLRNICWLDNGPRLFDCIEFSDQIATTDVLYDLSFLLMDLWHRDMTRHANLVANRYFDEAGEESAFGLLPFFMAIRAAVRAHVTATAAEESAADRENLAAAASSYFDLAKSLLTDIPAKLVAIGGFSGAGKSTVSETLADQLGSPPGARVLESDRIRKSMHGVAPQTHLEADAYRPEVSAKVYGEIFERSRAILSGGGSVLANAVFDLADMRAGIAGSADAANADFHGIWLDIDPNKLRDRVLARKGGTSDASVEVLERQLKRGAGDMEWQCVDAGQPLGQVVRSILNIVTHS